MNRTVTLQDMARTAPSSRCGSALRGGLLAFTAALLLLAAGAASAAPHGGGGGFHGGFARGGVAAGGFHGGFARGGVARGGVGRGYGRPYGYGRGGYGRRGYGWGGYGWPYWGLGLGLGIYLSSLPWDYSTYWWDGVPYYYTGNNYYVWDGAASEYQQVQPPSGPAQQSANAPPDQPTRLYAYPKNGQSTQQQARDEAACQEWASQQLNRGAAAPPAGSGEFTESGPPAEPGSTPPSSNSAVAAIAAATGGPPAANLAAGAGPTSEFLRAEAACLQGRGYSVD